MTRLTVESQATMPFKTTAMFQLSNKLSTKATVVLLVFLEIWVKDTKKIHSVRHSFI